MINIPNFLNESLEQMARNYDSQYQIASQVQDALFKDEYHVLNYERKYKQYDQEKEQVKLNYRKKTERLDAINRHLPYLRDTINKAKNDPTVLTEYETTYREYTLEKLSLERWMKENNATENNQDYMKYNLHRMGYEYHLSAGQQLAEWFATGAAGPGTVTFMGKEYIAA